ncbi:putative tail fiber protein [Psychrobacillus phage Perkons]|nr:putative tail fiber protein [Psychrobacillus phage Perkons]
MSSLLVLQNKSKIIMASDTATSAELNGERVRVSNDESKITKLNDLTIFASGNMLIRNIFIELLSPNDTVSDIEYKLKNHIEPMCGEYSLEVVVGEVFNNYTTVTSLSSYSLFEPKVSIVDNDNTLMFTAGIKTLEIASSFEKNISSMSIMNSIIESYKENSCESIGGFIEINHINKYNSRCEKVKIDDMTSHENNFINNSLYLIVGERIYGKIIMGVNLAIEDESGILYFRGSRGQIFDRNGNEVMRLGLVSDDGSASECFGITSWNSVSKVELTDCQGISIYRKKLPNDWEKIFWVSASDGTLYTKDMVAERLKIVNDIGEEILNAETGYFDIGWFDKIVADGKLTTIEKYELWNKVNTIMSEYQLVLTHAESYKYSPNDNTYNYNVQNVEASKTASESLIVDTTQLKLKYNSLIAFVSNYISIPPAFVDEVMERVDEIDRETFAIRFKEYHDEARKVRDAIDNYLVYSGLQMGKFYNNLIMDKNAGFMAIRNDYKYRSRLSATEGLVLEKWENGQWVKKLFATNEGTLKAVDLIAQRLIITGDAGEVFIDGNLGLIDFSAFKMIVGQLRAENIYSDVITAQDGFINDLVVNRLKTIDFAKASSGGDYVHIQDNYIKFIEASPSGGSSQARDFNGNLMYWTDSSHEQRTLKNTAYPVMINNLTEKEKMKLHFTTKDGEKVPVIEMSVGGSGTSNIGYIYKTTKDMVFEYYNSGSKQRRIRLRDEGIILDTQDGVVAVNGGNFYVSGTAKESGWTKDTFKSEGGFFIPANANGVYNKFQDAARWKLDDDNYIFQDDKTINLYVGKTVRASIRDDVNGGYGLLVNGTVKASHLELTAGSSSGGVSVIKPNVGGKIRIEADANNYIEISPAGIKQVGTVINLN